MSYSPEWDVLYRRNTQMSVWPWTDVVSLVMRHARPTGPDFRVLELGCGAGANIRFFNELGVQYFGVDGSSFIMEKLQKEYPQLAPRLTVCDFTTLIPFEGAFDLVVDRSALTFNNAESIQRALALVHSKLKTHGKMIGVDWYSTDHAAFKKAHGDGDAYTRTGYTDGTFAEMGRVHFFNKEHLLDLLKGFRMVTLEHKSVVKEVPETGEPFVTWNFVAEKI